MINTPGDHAHVAGNAARLFNLKRIQSAPTSATSPTFVTSTSAQSGLTAQEFKAAVIQNQEIVALVGALVMTISFAVHLHIYFLLISSFVFLSYNFRHQQHQISGQTSVR